MLRAALFDLFGTLLDVYSVQLRAEEMFPGHGGSIARLWRDKQIEYTRLRTLSNRYLDFSAVTRDALEYVFDALALDASAADLDALTLQYRRLEPFADAAPALQRLRAAGLPLGVLSNGDPSLLAAALEQADLGRHVDHLLSVDRIGVYKTAPGAYALGTAALGIDAREVLFVSANAWDAIGATWFGYTTCWVNRGAAAAERLGVQPTHEVTSLAAAADLLLASG